MALALCPICGGFGTDRNRKVCTYCAGTGKDPYQKSGTVGVPGRGRFQALPAPLVARAAAWLCGAFVAYRMWVMHPGDAQIFWAVGGFVAGALVGLTLGSILARPVRFALILGAAGLGDWYFLKGAALAWLGDRLPATLAAAQTTLGL